MLTCRNCNTPLVRVNGELLKCSTCGFTYKPGQTTPLLTGYTPKQLLTPKVTTADQEMDTFIDRLARKLMPVYKDYTPEVKKQLFANQAKIKEEFRKVLDGKISFQKWFDKTRNNLGKHEIDLGQILIDCSEGLQSKEAREFRAGCEAHQKQVIDWYNAKTGAPPT